MQRQAPLVLQRARQVLRGRARVALHRHVAELAGRLEQVVIGVGDHAHREAVDLGRRARERLRRIDANGGEHAAGQAQAAGAHGCGKQAARDRLPR